MHPVIVVYAVQFLENIPVAVLAAVHKRIPGQEFVACAVAVDLVRVGEVPHGHIRPFTVEGAVAYVAEDIHHFGEPGITVIVICHDDELGPEHRVGD